MKYIYNTLTGLILLLMISHATAGQFFASEGIAIRGYDTVSYFTDNKAVEGKAEYAYSWHGATWHFSSAKNLELFKASPQNYVPQFGGFCALGAAHEGAVPTNPEVFTIYKGRLYLNMTAPVGITWRLNSDFHIERATKAWESGSITFY
jgi:YHS domain-containing protein